MKRNKEDQPLTAKESAFVDFVIEEPNKTQAAIKAGYSKKSAYRIGCDNMKKPHILKAYNARLKEIEDARIAKAKEVMEFLTSVMRGEVKDQFNLDPTLSDRLDAAKQLQKRYGLDKVAVIGGEDGDNPIQTTPAITVYLPDNGRDTKASADSK